MGGNNDQNQGGNPFSGMFGGNDQQNGPEAGNPFSGFLNGGQENGPGGNPLEALQSVMGGSQEDSNFLGMVTQLYSLYQTNPKLVGNALQGFISNWSR